MSTDDTGTDRPATPNEDETTPETAEDTRPLPPWWIEEGNGDGKPLR
jgi:hypothetical protein